MQQRKMTFMLISVFAMSACANDPGAVVGGPPAYTYAPAEFSVVSDGRGELAQYPLGGNRAYLEALPGERYRVRVANHSDRRIGVVIAVDGRNIISGQKSWLGNQERMYILAPHEQAEYSGWRSGADRVNRFYFTEASDSYAGAFGDYSAMGVIALAVYPERQYPRRPQPLAGSDAAVGAAAESMKRAAPGTGYGESEYSPSQRVSFEPEAQPAQKTFLKYEWRASLCAKHILPDCGGQYPDSNRFWPNDNGFAPPPPGR